MLMDTIEVTFEALLRFLADLDGEQRRGMREGLSEEHLPVFDMLVEGNELSKAERGLVKQVARELLDALKAEKLRIDLWAEKEATRAEVKTIISEWLWSAISAGCRRATPCPRSRPKPSACTPSCLYGMAGSGSQCISSPRLVPRASLKYAAPAVAYS
jgi:hypothetical protein